jgi:hypothetical protein
VPAAGAVVVSIPSRVAVRRRIPLPLRLLAEISLLSYSALFRGSQFPCGKAALLTGITPPIVITIMS